MIDPASLLLGQRAKHAERERGEADGRDCGRIEVAEIA